MSSCLKFFPTVIRYFFACISARHQSRKYQCKLGILPFFLLLLQKQGERKREREKGERGKERVRERKGREKEGERGKEREGRERGRESAMHICRSVNK